VSQSSERPKVTALLLTYNHEQYIEQAFRSIMMQETNFDFEVVVSEDCSTDNTPEILRRLVHENPSWKDKVRLILREQNIGAQPNIADGYENCRGEYVAYLDGDDYWIDPTKLQRQVEAMEANDWIGCFHFVHIVDLRDEEKNSEYQQSIRPRVVPKEITLEVLARGYQGLCAYGGASMYRILPERRYKQEWIDRGLLIDNPLSILHADLGTMGFVPRVMSAYRVHGGGLWQSMEKINRYLGWQENLGNVEKCLTGESEQILANVRMETLRQWYEQAVRLEDDLKNSLSLRLARFFGYPLALAYETMFRGKVEQDAPVEMSDIFFIPPRWRDYENNDLDGRMCGVDTEEAVGIDQSNGVAAAIGR